MLILSAHRSDIISSFTSTTGIAWSLDSLSCKCAGEVAYGYGARNLSSHVEAWGPVESIWKDTNCVRAASYSWSLPNLSEEQITFADAGIILWLLWISLRLIFTNISCNLILSKLFIHQLTFRHRASCILGQAFHYSPENAFYIFNQQIYFIIWYLLDRASFI